MTPDASTGAPSLCHSEDLVFQIETITEVQNRVLYTYEIAEINLTII